MARAYRLNLTPLQLQNYASKSIPGVQIIELARHVDESGSFTELFRFRDGALLDPRSTEFRDGAPRSIDALRIEGVDPEIPEGLSGAAFQVRQINWSELEPGVVRAFHIHKRQTDVWFVPAHEKILVLLADLRGWPLGDEPGKLVENGVNVSKPIITQHQRVALGDGRSRLLVIPPMVAHGFRSLLDHKSRLLYAVNLYFDPLPEHCDEWRLPWDTFGEERWDIPNG